MLIPRKVKYRKMQKGKMPGMAKGGFELNFGSFGLIAKDRGYLTSRQIEAARRAMTRYIKREGKVWIRVFPDKPITHKPAETRMGSGKGPVDHYVAVIKPGRVLFEMDSVPANLAKEAMRLAASKIPFKTAYITKEE